MTTLAYGAHTFVGPTFLPSAGASEVARFASDSRTRRFVEYFRTARGQRLFVDPRQALDEQLTTADAMAAAGEAYPPSGAALQEAHSLIDSLPESFVRPAPYVEPSGAISFEWDFGKDRYAILAVKGTGVLEYSVATRPGERQWGVRNFSGRVDEDSLRILAQIGAAG